MGGRHDGDGKRFARPECSARGRDGQGKAGCGTHRAGRRSRREYECRGRGRLTGKSASDHWQSRWRVGRALIGERMYDRAGEQADCRTSKQYDQGSEY